MFGKHIYPVLRSLYASAFGLPTLINLEYIVSHITLHNFGALLGLCLIISSYVWILFIVTRCEILNEPLPEWISDSDWF